MAPFSQVFVENAKFVVIEVALKDDQSLFQLGSLDVVARRSAVGTEDHRHCLDVLRLDGVQEVFDCGTWRRSPGKPVVR